MDQQILSKEVVALVHNIELNQAGWWEKTVSRLVMAAVWKNGKAVDRITIKETLSGEFKLEVTNGKLDSILSKLENSGDLVRASGVRYQITESKRRVFDLEILAAEENQKQAQAEFHALIDSLALEIPATEAWAKFESHFLRPLVDEIGANAYGLVAGEAFTTDVKLVEKYLGYYDEKQRPLHRELVTAFLDPKSEVVRQYVSRLLHARFCVDATGLPEDTLQKLSTSIGRSLKFNVFVDTNFLFSLIGVHENPSNEAALELKELLGQLRDNPKVRLLITPETIREATNTIEATRQWLNSIPTTEPFIHAALKAGVSGIGEKFMVERLRQGANLTVNDWFKPYLEDFVTMARGNGIELHNAKLDHYSMRDDVLEDINHVLGVEKKRVELLKDRKEKSYESIKHDMVLWHFVKDKRPAYVESPVDAEDWILTVDYRLIRFDEAKQRRYGQRVPICIHPASMVQLLQFFVPRSKDFEEAMVGTIRLPFLFQEFDAEGQRTSMKILQGMGRFGLSKDATEETVTRVLVNESLRSRLARDPSPEEEIEMIKDALVEEMKDRLDAEAGKVNEIRGTLDQKEAELKRVNEEKDALAKRFEEEKNLALAAIAKEQAEALQKEKDEHAAERAKLLLEKHEQQRTIDELKRQADAQQSGQAEKDKKLSAHEDAIARLDAQLQSLATSKARNAAMVQYAIAFLVIVGLSISASFFGASLLPDVVRILDLLPVQLLIGLVVFVTAHLVLELLVRRNAHIQSLWPFQQMKKFRGRLWGVVFLGFIAGVAVNIYSNRVQKNWDQQQQNVPSGEQPNAAH